MLLDLLFVKKNPEKENILFEQFTYIEANIFQPEITNFQ